MSNGQILTRSETNRMVAGVCGGLGEHFGVDPTIVRIVFVLLAIFGGSGIVLYLVLWLIVPRASKAGAMPRDVVRDGVDEGRRLAQEGADAAKRGYGRLRGSRDDAGRTPGNPPPGTRGGFDRGSDEGPPTPPPDAGGTHGPGYRPEGLPPDAGGIRGPGESREGPPADSGGDQGPGEPRGGPPAG